MNYDVCEDSDPGCRYCAGRCTRDSAVTLFRVDMEDRTTGTQFCGPCAEEALESGVFTTEAPAVRVYEVPPGSRAKLRLLDGDIDEIECGVIIS